MITSIMALALGLPAVAPPAGFHRGVEPKREVQRIVSLAPSATEMLFALGAGPLVVGVTRYCDRPEGVSKLPKIGGFSDPSLEAVMALKPDLVVAVPAEANKRVVDRLVDLKVPVLVIPGTTVADVLVGLHALGHALKREGEAVKATGRIRAELDAVGRRVGVDRPPRALILYDHKPLVVAGPGSFADELLTLAGGINVVEKAAVPYPTLSMETLVRLAPDVIIDASMGGKGGDPGRTLALFERFSDLPAVRNGRVHVLPSGTLMRPGPYIGSDVGTLAELLHPSRKPDLSDR